MLVGTITKNPETAGIIGNIVTFPMMFLGGTFFPISTMPQYLQDHCPHNAVVLHNRRIKQCHGLLKL